MPWVGSGGPRASMAAFRGCSSTEQGSHALYQDATYVRIQSAWAESTENGAGMPLTVPTEARCEMPLGMP